MSEGQGRHSRVPRVPFGLRRTVDDVSLYLPGGWVQSRLFSSSSDTDSAIPKTELPSSLKDE